jgi:hypothetical protein
MENEAIQRSVIYVERRRGIAPTGREMIFLLMGLNIGMVLPRVLPKTKFVKAAKYYTEVFRAQGRLQKVCIEEYERIDEAIKTEEEFLKILDPQNTFSAFKARFEVRDEEGQRRIHLHLDAKKKGEE